MGLLGDIFMGTALTGLTSMCEDIERNCPGAPIGPRGFDALPTARRAELARKVPKWVATLRKQSPEVVTINIIKNMHVADASGRPARVRAHVRLMDWLVASGIAADPDDVLDAHGVGQLPPGQQVRPSAWSPAPKVDFTFSATMPQVSPSSAVGVFEMDSLHITFFVDPPLIVEPAQGVAAPIRYLFAAAVYAEPRGLLRICTLEEAFGMTRVYGTFSASGMHSVLDPASVIDNLSVFQRVTFEQVSKLHGVRPSARETHCAA